MTSGAGLDALVREAARRLADAGVEAPAGDAENLLAFVLGTTRGEVGRLRALGRDLPPGAGERFGALVARRAERVPLQHLTGTVHVRRLSLEVGPGVFVPRPETEVAVGLALDAVRAAPSRPVRLVDLCAGSGVVALAVATEAADAGVEVEAVAVELSPAAAAYARRNAARLGGGRVEVRQGPVEGCCPDLDGRVDVVTANPPYVPDGAVPRDPEARDHDPSLALFGGPDGMRVVRQVAAAAARLLRDGGSVVVEHGEHQATDVASVLSGAGLVAPVVHRDLTGRPRTTVAVRDCRT